MAIYIDDKKFNYDEALKHLGVTNKVPSKGSKKKVFRLTRITPDRENGGVRVKKSINTVPKFVVMVPSLGTYVTIRFATQQIPQRDGEPKYSPTLLSMQPDEEGAMLVNDSLEFLFWYLHPKHKLSPFHDGIGVTNYCFVDKDQEAKTELERDAVLISCLSILVGDNKWNIFKLRKFAKGIRLVGIDEMSDNEVVNLLRQKAYKNPTEFYNQMQSRTAHFDGIVTDAIDKQILKIQELHGLKRWYLKDEEILPITYGEDEKQALYEHIANNSQSLLPLINTALEKTERSEILKNANVDNLLGLDSEKEISNAASIQELADTISKKEDNLSKVDNDEGYRNKIKENLNLQREQGEALHHKKKEWLEEHKEAVEYYIDTYEKEKV